jgi:hypothetical protein
VAAGREPSPDPCSLRSFIRVYSCPFAVQKQSRAQAVVPSRCGVGVNAPLSVRLELAFRRGRTRENREWTRIDANLTQGTAHPETRVFPAPIRVYSCQFAVQKQSRAQAVAPHRRGVRVNTQRSVRLESAFRRGRTRENREWARIDANVTQGTAHPETRVFPAPIRVYSCQFAVQKQSRAQAVAPNRRGVHVNSQRSVRLEIPFRRE